jgi:nucleotide-binding universal stress UspA family protein
MSFSKFFWKLMGFSLNSDVMFKTMFTSLLLCTHGTAGAQYAEHLVFADLCLKNPELDVTVLTIIDQDWQSMTGDDWLNSSKTHTKFLDHVEQQMQEENEEDWQKIKNRYPAASKAEFVGVVGEIAPTIAAVAEKKQSDIIVIGPYRESRRLFNLKMEKGLRARINPATLHPLLPCPLLIAPVCALDD